MSDIHKRLAYTLANLPQAIPQSAKIVHYFDVLRELRKLAERFPHLTRGPRSLMPFHMSDFPSAKMTLGHGEQEMIWDVFPHGGEPISLATVVPHAEFLCENEWLLEGRRVTYLFTSPDASIYNTLRWGVRETLPQAFMCGELNEAITHHWRDGNSLAQDCWSWPLDDLPGCDHVPTEGAQAGMRQIQDIRKRGGVLVLWHAGHNALVAADVQFHLTGPNDAVTAADLEWLTRLGSIRLALDTGPFESSLQQGHQGTMASCNVISGRAIRQLEPNAKTGGSPQDWGITLFPEMAMLACEVGMFRPANRHLTCWKNMTVGRARNIANGVPWDLEERLKPLVEIAFELDPCDPTVAATRSLLGSSAHAWPETDDNLILDPREAFTRTCKWPLYRARAAAAASQMVYRHLGHLQSLGHDPYFLAGMLDAAILDYVQFWRFRIKRWPPARAIRLHALAAETAFYGALGVHIDRTG